MPPEFDTTTREGRLKAMRETGVMTEEEYEFALREGLDITDNIGMHMAMRKAKPDPHEGHS